MKERDSELDQLLAPMRSVHPSSQQISRWQKALLPAPRRWQGRALELAAALVVGFVLGAVLFKSQSPEPEQVFAEKDDGYATIERVYVKN